jgi:hypothetical protein
MRHSLIYLVVLEFDMLVQGTLRAIGLLTGLNHTSIMPFNLTGSPSEPFLPILLIAGSVLYLLSFFLKLAMIRTSILLSLFNKSDLSEMSSFICEVSTTLAR